MPVVAEETKRAGRSRRVGLLWLLLLPPLLLAGLIAATAYQPLRIGPLVLASDVAADGNSRVRVEVIRVPLGTAPIVLRHRSYTATRHGYALVLRGPTWSCGVGWFLGHPASR